MGISRDLLIWCSQNSWMKTNVPNMSFVKSAVKRFMPGEELMDAIQSTKNFNEVGIKTVFTCLGENIKDLSEAEEVSNHYIKVLESIKQENIKSEISLKLTHIGFDFSFDKTYELFKHVLYNAEQSNNFVWIDMEQSAYIERTLEFYKRAKAEFENVGLCLQSYLYRTKADLEGLLSLSPNIRLVKGAYSEPVNLAFKNKSDVDNNYFEIAKILLTRGEKRILRTGFATHDVNLISRIEAFANNQGIDKDKLEFQMLYGIKSNEQLRLVKEGYKVIVLISYGKNWYPWYMRRLAERPANVGFVLKNLFNN
jgi:proline dehydrogenase